MRKAIFILLAGTMLTSTAHAEDYGVTESEAYFGELFHKWETTSYSDWNGKSNVNVNEQAMVSTAMEAQGWTAGHHNTSAGWCNEAVIWAMDNVSMFEDDVMINASDTIYMKGRHFTDLRNDNVEQSFNHDDTFDWADVPIGTVALLDWQSSPKSWGSYGIDHTSTFMGVIEGTDYGWFLGGNQSGRLQPKMYRLSDMTFGSTFDDSNADVTKHHYTNIEEYASIELEDGTWSKTKVNGWGYGTNNAPYNDGDATSRLMSKQWKQHKPNITKFTSGENIVYIQDDAGMEVYTRDDGTKKIIRSVDYFDHVEIENISNFVDDYDEGEKAALQNGGDWWQTKTSYTTFDKMVNWAESQEYTANGWYREVTTALAINEAVDKVAGSDNYNEELARELYITYDVEYNSDEEDLESNVYD